MNEAFTVKTGATYAVWDIELGKLRQESYTIGTSGPMERMYLRESLTICDISFRTPISEIQAGMCGTMTHGEDAWRVRVVGVLPMLDSLEVRGLALVSARSERLDSAPSPEPPSVVPEVYTQFYDL